LQNMNRKSALSNAGANIFGVIPTLSNLGQDRRAQEREETNDHRNGNRMRSNASSLSFGFEGNDPYLNHRTRAKNTYRTSTTAPTSTQGRNLTYEDNKTKNMRGNNIIPGMLTERKHDYSSARNRSQNDDIAVGSDKFTERDILVRARDRVQPTRNRKAELQAKAMKLAMQMNLQQVDARKRTQTNQHQHKFSVAVMKDDNNRNLHLKKSEVDQEEQKARNDSVRINRMVQKKAMQRNQRSQIHNINQHGSSAILARERNASNEARVANMPDLTLEELQKMSEHLQGCR